MLGIIIQARMGSIRLPGKILKLIGTKTLLEHIIFRLEFLQHKTLIVIATTDLSIDNPVEQFCTSRHIDCFRGSEKHVLERYFRCAAKYDFKKIIRLTGDNPFTDIEELDRLIDLYDNHHADFCHSFRSLPIGVGAEIFSREALGKSFQNATEPHHAEHVDEYMLEHPEIFKTFELEVSTDKNHPKIRLTIDTEQDYKKACYIVNNATQEFVSTQEAIKLCMAYA